MGEVFFVVNRKLFTTKMSETNAIITLKIKWLNQLILLLLIFPGPSKSAWNRVVPLHPTMCLHRKSDISMVGWCHHTECKSSTHGCARAEFRRRSNQIYIRITHGMRH